jgi:hypothetical protein
MTSLRFGSKSIPPKPSCFPDDDTWIEWYQKDYESGNKNPLNICLDCTPEYQAEMVKLGFCVNPKHNFAEIEEDEEEGYKSE